MLFLLLSAALAFAQDLPPKTLFHIGHKEFLLEDAALGKIPDAVWEKQIMGPSTRYGLVPYRRGLYGGEDLDSLELYANLLLGSQSGQARKPWVMKITLKDECRQPGAVTDLATDDRYLDWLLRNISGLLAAASPCLNNAAEGCQDLIGGTQGIAYGREENTCDDLLQGYLAEAKPRVVRDAEWDGSWYLRAQSCIEKLEASPSAVLEMLADAKWDWQSRQTRFPSSDGGYGLGFLAMAIGALADLDGAPEAVTAKLRVKLAASDMHEKFLAESRIWLKSLGPAVIDAYRRCENKNGRESFRAEARSTQTDLADQSFLEDDALPTKLMARFRALCP